MPEGDTIFRAARSLHNVLAGHLVTRFETAYAHLDRVNVDTPIVGRSVEKCVSAGKHLLIIFSGDVILRTHMRMNGSWHLYRHGERWWRGPQAMRVRIDTADWVAVAFNVSLPQSRATQVDEFPAAFNTDPPDSHPPAPEEMVKLIELPEGFNATLFAGEPDVQQPICMDFDDRGR